MNPVAKDRIYPADGSKRQLLALGSDLKIEYERSHSWSGAIKDHSRSELSMFGIVAAMIYREMEKTLRTSSNE